MQSLYLHNAKKKQQKWEFDKMGREGEAVRNVSAATEDSADIADSQCIPAHAHTAISAIRCSVQSTR